MSEARPKIFISAVSKELGKAREKIAEVLRLLQFEPVLQQEFPNHTGVVKAMLEVELEPCAAVIQIVGHRYGWEVHGAADPTEVMSYTHYEAIWAHRKPMPIWYLIVSDDYHVDVANDEDERKRVFQTAYRYRVQSTGHLFFPVADIKDVEIAVFRMQQDLDKLRPARLRHFQLADDGSELEAHSAGPGNSSTPDAADLESIMRSVLSDFVPALQQVRQNNSQEDDEEAEDRLYARIAHILGMSPAEARFEIEALARKTKVDTTEPLLERAKAAYALKDFPAAERFALEAAAQAIAENPPNETTYISALCEAGEAAAEQTQYKRAIDHYQTAALLTNPDRDVVTWAGVHNEVGWLLYLDGQYNSQFEIMNWVWKVCAKAGYPEHPTTLRSHHQWACALSVNGDHSGAEKEHRSVIAVYERVLGPEHPDTLNSRNNLAITLSSQGKHAEAEAEYRAVLAIRRRIRGPEHLETLTSRNNLAIALNNDGKHAEAENEHRTVFEILERILGPEHPKTLMSRNNLANALYSQGKYYESEVENRAVLAIRERVLESEHPDTLNSRGNLANALGAQGKYTDSEAEQRVAISIQQRVLKPEHPDLLNSYHNLSLTLVNQGRKADALDFARRALAGRSKVLGEDHPDLERTKRLVEHLEAQ